MAPVKKTMHYENFSRHLREKYSTRVHVADQLVDQLKQKNSSSSSRASWNENRKVSEPYLNECILAAERMKNNRRSERDRQICYENMILVEKLERIRKQSGQNSKENLEKNYRNHCRLVVSKVKCEHETNRSINKRLGLINEQIFDSNEERFSETGITSYHSLSPVHSESDVSSSENEDDQATAADVDISMDYSDFTPPVLRQNKEIYSSKTDRVYQHLTNIDMTMIRDASPQPSKHFSICILPHFDSDLLKSRNPTRQYAFKKEILYH